VSETVDQVLDLGWRARDAARAAEGSRCPGPYRVSYVAGDTTGESFEPFSSIWEAIDAVVLYVPVGATFRVYRVVAGGSESVTVIEGVRSTTRPTHIDPLPVS
jgi:hypothetical protein